MARGCSSSQILLDEYEKLLNPRTKLVSFTQVSNALGTITPAHRGHRYLDQIGMENIARHEHELLVYATQELLRIPGLCIIGTAKEKPAYFPLCSMDIEQRTSARGA